jgi:hypothetical protein
MDIKEELLSMDGLDDAQWTADGAPKLSYFNEKVTRQEILDIAPEFSRENMVIHEDEVPESVQTYEKTKEYCAGDIMSPEEFSKFLADVPKHELKSLEEAIASQADGSREAIEDTKVIDNKVKLALDMVRARVSKEFPDISNQQALMNHIAAQNKSRAAKVERSKEALKGLNIEDLDPRAAIDRAFTRRNKRGMARPTR